MVNDIRGVVVVEFEEIRRCRCGCVQCYGVALGLSGSDGAGAGSRGGSAGWGWNDDSEVGRIVMMATLWMEKQRDANCISQVRRWIQITKERICDIGAKSPLCP